MQAYIETVSEALEIPKGEVMWKEFIPKVHERQNEAFNNVTCIFTGWKASETKGREAQGQ